jgi:hypothetical protein
MIAIFAFSVATKDFSHDLFLDQDRRRFPHRTLRLGTFCRPDVKSHHRHAFPNADFDPLIFARQRSRPL